MTPLDQPCSASGCLFFGGRCRNILAVCLYARGLLVYAVVESVIANGVRLALMIFLAAQGSLTGTAGLEAIAWGSLVALIPGFVVYQAVLDS